MKNKKIYYEKSSEIIELANAFENCTLPLDEWTHEAHLMIAFWYLYLNNLPEALFLIRNGIKRFNFDNLEVGQFYILTVQHKRYGFAQNSQAFTLNEDLTNLLFRANWEN